MTEENKSKVELGENGEITRDEMMIQVLKDAEPLSEDAVRKEIRAFIKRFLKTRYFILNSKKINYIAIFDSNNAKTKDKVEHILDYMNESVFYIVPDVLEDAEREIVKLNNIKDIFTEEDGSLGMYIGETYFRLYDGDKFVEKTVDIIKGDK